MSAPDESSTTTRHYRWDLDKTYLRTDFDTTRDLVRTFLQSAEDKRNVPGARRLLQELLAPSSDDEPRMVSFVSGSPRQMRRVLTEKLRLDGIEPHQFILKPNLSNLLTLNFAAIRSQVGYKLEALLTSRVLGARVDELLFGDDAEQDALTYSLYADVIAGIVRGASLQWVLREAETDRRTLRRVMALVEHLEPSSSTRVERIFIHLARRSPTTRFDAFGARVVPTYNYFQTALVLYADRHLSSASTLRVIQAMGAEGYTASRLANSVQDLMRRGFLGRTDVDRLIAALGERDLVLGRPGRELARRMSDVLATMESLDRPPAPRVERIDYLAACSDLGRYVRERRATGGIGLLRRRS